MLVRPDPRAARFGLVEVGEQGRVLRVAGRPLGFECGTVARWTGLFTGAWVLSAEAISRLPEQGCLVRQGLWRWLEEGRLVLAVRDESRWQDLGTLGRYAATHWDLAEGRLRWPGIETTSPEGLLHPDVRLGAGARLRGCVLGAGVAVAPGSRLHRVVAWPGARLAGDLHEAIVTPRQVVRMSVSA